MRLFADAIVYECDWDCYSIVGGCVVAIWYFCYLPAVQIGTKRASAYFMYVEIMYLPEIFKMRTFIKNSIYVEVLRKFHSTKNSRYVQKKIILFLNY